ncbi:hypothetical protein [Rhizobium straminoryzae]|uniref:M15 family metallopeptidase n=1 Tax=Rhizobium straminoryzae TaxID=1387186 RepID=A0A549TGJ8_9HYPH|nr:hypothetical protein [Rhizobium straminoryzae]TRL41904.1 hypothetical protein FNA46_03285 [Rhizobium straminoryzae]
MVNNEPVVNHGAALRAMMNRPYLENPKYDEQQWRANREGAHPKILEFEEAMVRRMASLGVPMFAHCIVRTPADQDAAYALGRSRLRGSDPYPHRFAAVDLIHCNRGWDLPEMCWDMIGHIGNEVAKRLSIPIVWGGDWDGDGDKSDQKLYDPAHWELAHWRMMEPEPPHMYNARGKLVRRE